jgi:predicted flap endonuclease-1-like 5' DNA nuclease
MLLVAAEIVAYLIVAALLGFVAAWALRGALLRGKSAAAPGESTAPNERQAELEARLAQRDEHITALQQRLASLEQATHAASAQLLKTEHYGEIPRFLEQLGVGPRATARTGSNGAAARAGADAYDQVTGNLFEDDPPQPTRPLPRDDLKKVHGIGPRFERTLHELGVQTYKQIALWRDQDIVKYARELRTFPERLHRDEWVRSAREQHLLKYGERL